MVRFVEGLPSVLGALAALVVGLVSLSADASLGVFVVRVASALIVFWAFGLVMRALLSDAAHAAQAARPAGISVDSIPPGTRVSALLDNDSAGGEEMQR